MNNWKLFPAKWDGKKHIGLVKWATQAGSDQEIIKAWKRRSDCYLCVALNQSDLTVLDVDNKHGVEGSKTWKLLELSYQKFPNTLMVKTPSGGYHYYFLGRSAHTIGKLGPGIDTPVMVPLAGETVPGKGTYEVINNVKIAPLPEWLKKLIGEPRLPKKQPYREPAIALDISENTKRAIDWLLTAAITAIEGEGGDRITYEIACGVRDFGVSEEVCLSIMLEHWNLHCSPPWKSDDLARKVNNAYQYARSQVGISTPQADFAEDLIEPGTPTNQQKSPRKLTDFIGEPPPRKWILPDWLPQGEISSLIGDGGLGKSLLSIQLAMAVASNTKFLNLQVEKQIPVLLVACEDTYEELHRRITSIHSAQFDFLTNLDIPLYFWSRVGENNLLAYQDHALIKPGPFAKELKETLLQMGTGHKLIIFDTLSDIFAGNENDRTVVNLFVKYTLSRIIKNHNTTILFTAHPSKSSKEAKEASGSTAWNAVVRNRWALYRHENPNLDVCVLERRKSNYSPSGEAITLQWNSGAFQPVNANELENPIEEENLTILLNLITECVDKQQPLTLRGYSTRNLKNLPVNGAGGRLMSNEEKLRLTSILASRNLIVEIKNQKNLSGLWPVVGTPEETVDNPF